MRVQITNEKTAKSDEGISYKIIGLKINKKDSDPVIYPTNSEMCKAVIFPGLFVEAINMGKNEIYIL